MNLALILLAFFTNTAIYAQGPYTLKAFENDGFRDFSLEELLNRLGESRALLAAYVCNGKNENDILWAPLRENPQGNSLKIMAYKTDELATYKGGKLFDEKGKVIKNTDDPFFQYAQSALQILEKIPESARLLRHLEKSYFPLTVKYGTSRFAATEENGRLGFGYKMARAIPIYQVQRMDDDELNYSNIGVGGIITWNPKPKVNPESPDSALPPHITLVHEMYHAFDSIRGILDFQRFVQGDGYEFIEVSEFRAVYFENQIRRASGVSYRTHYREDHTGAGVLDSQGEPIMIPSACL